MYNTQPGYLYSVKTPPVKGVIRSKLSPNDISLLCAKGGGAALAVTEELSVYTVDLSIIQNDYKGQSLSLRYAEPAPFAGGELSYSYDSLFPHQPCKHE